MVAQRWQLGRDLLDLRRTGLGRHRLSAFPRSEQQKPGARIAANDRFKRVGDSTSE